MSSIQIKKVTSKNDLKKFIDLHYELYAGSPYDVPNLYDDEWNTLSKDKNAAFEFCEAEYFLAFKDGKIVGVSATGEELYADVVIDADTTSVEGCMRRIVDEVK